MLVECECCGSDSVEVGTEAGHINYLCLMCGYQKFLLGGEDIDSDVYEQDSDYGDDLLLAVRGKDLLLWHHKYALKHIQSASLNEKLKCLDVGCFNGFFVMKRMRSLSITG